MQQSAGKQCEGASGGSMIKLVVAKIVCCGAIGIVATVGIGVVGVWFLEDGIFWLMAVAVLVIATRPVWKARPDNHPD